MLDQDPGNTGISAAPSNTCVGLFMHAWGHHSATDTETTLRLYPPSCQSKPPHGPPANQSGRAGCSIWSIHSSFSCIIKVLFSPLALFSICPWRNKFQEDQQFSIQFVGDASVCWCLVHLQHICLDKGVYFCLKLLSRRMFLASVAVATQNRQSGVAADC